MKKWYETEDFAFKTETLKYFWNHRNNKLVSTKESLGGRKQKFLVFYNLFSMIKSKPYSLNGLKAFKEGPVFNDVFRVVKEEKVYIENLNLGYDVGKMLDKEILDITTYFISSMTFKEVSTITHEFDFWNKKYVPNPSNLYENDIYERDISDRDREYLLYIFDLYKKNLYGRYTLYKAKHNVIAIPISKFSEIHENKSMIELMDKIVMDYNPVQIDLDAETGGLLIDC